MPSSLHETLVEMFRRSPALAAELLGGVLGVSLPAYEQVRLDASDFTDLTPTEYRSDAVVVLSALPAAARASFTEAFMDLSTDEPQSDFWRRRFAEAKARATAVLDVLDARGIAFESSDPDEMNRWLRRAATAESVEELFR
jgi:hypothetical protein